jgi:hypothetical protein
MIKRGSEYWNWADVNCGGGGHDTVCLLQKTSVLEELSFSLA